MKGKEAVDLHKSPEDHFSKLGFKWRFFIFSAVYRNVCYNNYTISFVTVIIDTVLSLFPMICPQIAYISGVPDKDHIWFSDKLFDTIPTQQISANVIIGIFAVLYLFFLAIFFLCVILPAYIRKLHIFLSFPVHITVFHFSAAVFGYCIHYLIYFLNEDAIRSTFSIIFLILFCLYFAFFTYMCYIETNSLIHPNPFYGEWFHGLSLFYPFWIFFVQNASYHTQRIPDFTIRIVIYSFVVLVSLFAGLEFVRIQPFLLFLMNDIQSTKSIAFALYGIFAIIINCVGDRFGTYTISSIPTITILIFILVHYFAEKRRKSHERVLHQLEDVENLTSDAIKVALSSIRSDAQLNLVIKRGFSSGNPVVSSFQFIRYCFERSKPGNWILSFLVFLYGTVWGSDPNSYKFFLHMLSIEKYRLVPELLLFQNIYCFMQSAENLSPVVYRYLEKYRWSVLILTQAHHDFWMRAITCTQLNEFHDLSLDIAYNYSQNAQNLQNLQAMFPYSPSVMFESSMFAADFEHQFLRASNFYEKGVNMAKNGFKSVSSDLFHGFEVSFPFIVSIEETYTTETSEYDFISLMEHQDRAQRQSNVFCINDNYIKTISNHFSLKQELLPTNVTYFRSETFTILLSTILMGLAVFILFFIHLSIQDALPNDKKEYMYLASLLEQTVHFRQVLTMSQYDIMLILTIQSRMYESLSMSVLRTNNTTPPILEDPFFWFAVKHLSLAEEITSSYKYYFEHMNETLSVDKLYAFGQEFENMTFLSLYLDFHSIAIMFVQSRSISSKDFDEVYFYMIIESLSDIAIQIYKLLANEMKNLAKGTVNRYLVWFMVLPCCDVLLLIILTLFYYYSTNDIIKNIFSIIRTIQRPALKSIANRFNKLLLLKEHHIPAIHRNRFYRPVIYFAICLIMLAISPLYFLKLAVNVKDEPVVYEPLPPLPPIDDSMNFMYYTFAVLEFLEANNYTIMKNYNKQLISDVFGQDSICIHEMFNKISNIEIFTYKFYEDLNLESILTTTIITLSICTVFFFLFIWSSSEIFKLYRIVHIMLHFIPLQASQTNPVLSQLQNDQRVSFKKMQEFSKELRKQPDSLNFFYAIFFDENDFVIKTVGNLSKLFKRNLTTFEQISSHIIRKSTLNEGPSFESFFSERLKNPVFFSFSKESEFSMLFNSRNELFIKDETVNLEVNQKRRIIQELNKSVEMVKPRPGLNTNQIILFIIDQIPAKDMKNVFNVWLQYKENIIKFDSRQHRFVYMICVNGEDERETGLRMLVTFLNSIQGFLKDSRIALDYGGPIQIFDNTKSMMAKSRIIGKIYDRLSILASFVSSGHLWISRDLAHFIGFEENEVIFKDFQITDDEIIGATHLTMEQLQAHIQ